MGSNLEESRAAGFSKHLIKPINISALTAILAEFASGTKEQAT